MKYKLSKKIVYKIIKEEIENTNIPVNIELVNKYENIYNIIKREITRKLNDNQRTFIETISEIKKELNREYFAEYNQFDNSFKICLTTIKNATINERDYLWNLMISAYHEYKHTLIYNELQIISDFKIDSLHNFYILIDYLIDDMSNYYEIKPENFYEEIIADVYANKKTTQFLNNYPHLKSKLQLYIEKDKIFTDINYQNYDVQKIFNIINKLIKRNFNRYEYFDFIFPYGIIPVLYNNNGTFKDIKTLITEKEWNNYPKEVQYLIISSKAYLDDINYENITKEELEIIEKSLEYTYNLEEKRYQTNEKLKYEIYKLHKQTKKSKCPDKKLFQYDDLLSILKEKEIYNTKKLEYLDYQISKIVKLIYNKKMLVKK